MLNWTHVTFCLLAPLFEMQQDAQEDRAAIYTDTPDSFKNWGVVWSMVKN